MKLIPQSPFQGLIQIAGVHDIPEAQECLSAGVHALGFPLRLPVHTEDLTEQAAAQVADAVRHAATPVLITYLSQANAIAELCRSVRMNHVQLHGSISPEELDSLRGYQAHNDSAIQRLFIIKSLVIKKDGSNVHELEHMVKTLSPYVDAFITDTHDPATGADGATGQTHDWEISRKLVTLSPVPVILAGGLNPNNVYDAICTVRPAGVDAHTGVEGPDGRKHPQLLQKFVQRAQQGFAAIAPNDT